MRCLISLTILALLTGWLCGVPYCGPLALLVGGVAFAWEKEP